MLAPGGGLGAGGHSAKPLKSQTDLFLLLSDRISDPIQLPDFS